MSCSHRGPAGSASANPDLACQDFYQYANREWLASATIPPDEERWSVRLEMKRRTLDKLHAILESVVTVGKAPGSLESKLGTFYGTCMDAERAESDGAGPLRPQLARIDAIDARDALVREIGRLRTERIPALFWLAGAQDPRHSTDVIAEVAATGILGLPDRNDYLRAGPDAERLRTEYVAHVARTRTGRWRRGLRPRRSGESRSRPPRPASGRGSGPLISAAGNHSRSAMKARIAAVNPALAS
jgi:putative endopeptidase